MADGIVYVFNQTSKAISAFAPNGFTAGAISRWMGPETEAPYTSVALAVRLVAQSSKNKPGNFGYGLNRVMFKTDVDRSFTIDIEAPKTQQSTKKGTKKIDPLDPTEPQTLLLYLAEEQWTLMSTKGIVLQIGKIARAQDEEEDAA